MLNAIAEAVVFLSRSPELALLTKATLMLLSGLAIARVARRARASVRHVIIATSFASLVALPVLIAFVPVIGIEVEASAAVLPAASSQTSAAPHAPARSAVPGFVAQARTPLPISWPRLMRFAWIGGAVVFLIPVAAALWRLSMIRRTGLPVAWHRDQLSRLADARGVSVPVELLEHEAVPGPMTFGISRPVIVLPLDAREWSDAELRRALMHELEHIQRGDWLMQIVARTVAAVYWFHPLVWSAWRRLCLEAERSCDDAVVISEERTDYAEQLVSLAERMSATPVQPMLGMANRSDLSTRVTAVLDDRLRRGRAGFTFAAGTVAAAALMVLTVAPVRAIAKADAVVTQSDREQIERKLEQAAKTRAVLKRKIEDPSQRGDSRRRVRAIDRALYEAANEGQLDEVKDLVQAGASPSAIIYGDGSPLIGAARSGRAEIARYLLDQGADPNGIVPGDGSALIAAAGHGRLDQVQMLVERGADVNLAVEGDENPLMNAAEGGHLMIVQYLVSKGADIHTRIFNERRGSRDGGAGEWRTALSQARKNDHTSVVKYLESLGARDQ
jgi:beta-lactamase regulating signal transducer with metallopeptidase domain